MTDEESKQVKKVVGKDLDEILRPRVEIEIYCYEGYQGKVCVHQADHSTHRIYTQRIYDRTDATLEAALKELSAYLTQIPKTRIVRVMCSDIGRTSEREQKVGKVIGPYFPTKKIEWC